MKGCTTFTFLILLSSSLMMCASPSRKAEEGINVGFCISCHQERTPGLFQSWRTFHVGDEVARMGPGKLLRVPFQSPMSIKNESGHRLAFLVIKAPHPNQMG